MAGTVKANQLTIGDSATDTQNFALKTNVDGTMKLARKSDASGGDILTVDASGKVAFTQGTIGGSLTLGTAQNSTSGTSINFTGIPSWAKRVTVMFNGVSTNGTSNILVQIGTGGTPTTSGYTGQTNGGAGALAFGAGFIALNNVVAANTAHGQIILTHMGANIWTMVGAVVPQTATNTSYGAAGSVSIAGALDNIRITTAGGADTFDAGSINILYEG